MTLVVSPAILLAATAALLAAPGTPLSAQTPAQNDSAATAARGDDALPLIATRTLEFTTDEGTWINLDLSPDGETIVFELLGDLYTLPVEGGEATRITRGMAYDMQPEYSPDGSHLVFVSDRNGSENLWMANADGTDARPLTTGERDSYMSPIWTPDGEYVIASEGSDLHLWHVDGGSGVQITGNDDDQPNRTHFGPAFGADEDYLWLNIRGPLGGGLPDDYADGGADSGAGAGGGGDPHPHDEIRSSAREVGDYQIAQLERESGRIQVRTHEMEGAFGAMPSPDGRWLVYTTRHDARQAMKLRDLETGDETWLVMDVQRDESQGGSTRDRDVYPNSAWTPDSEALITFFGGKIMRVEVPSGETSEIPFTARVEQELGPLVKFDYPINDSTLTVSQIRGARPSPDGSRLVFAALDRLWIADLPADNRGGPGAAEGDGDDTHPTLTNARRLTEDEWVEHNPVWSADGEWIAYVTWDDSIGGDIWRVPVGAGGAADAAGGTPERLTAQSAFYDKLSYDATGERLMAVRGSRLHRMRTLEDFGGHSGAAELEYVWLPAEGGETTRSAWVGGGATQQGRNRPHVGPDPDRLYVWNGSDGLMSMRFDGTDRRSVVKVSAPGTGGSSTPDEVVLSPDGRRAVVRANRKVWVVTVPPVGGEAPTVSVTGSTMPARALTDIGGDFVGWSADGSVAHWSIGRSYFQHDVALADSLFAAEEAAERAEEAAEEEADEPDEPDEPEEEEAEASDDDEDLPAYEPFRADVEIVVAKDKPEGLLALTNARLITMRDREVIERGDLLIRDNRIEAIGPSGTLDIPAGTETRDMSGRTIYPGLVDIHAHAWVAWGVHREQVSQFMAQLAWGVTTQRDPQTSSEDIVTYSDLMETGELLGPRLYSTGPGVFSRDLIGSLDDARDVLRRYSDHYNTLTIKQYLAGDRKVRQWVIMAARELGLTPTTEGGSNFTMNLTLMQDGYAGLEHSLPISPLYDDVLELGAFSGLVYTPTLVVAYGGPSGLQYYLTREPLDEMEKLRRFTPHDEIDKWQSTTWYREDQYVHFQQAEQLRKWMERGGQLGLGSHGEVQGLGTHWELWMMASGGMDPHDALIMATLQSADAIGLDTDLGSLEPGKLADLQILRSNPLDDIHNSTDIEYVMKNGRLYEGDTLDEVWPRQQELPTMWWWRVEPEGN